MLIMDEILRINACFSHIFLLNFEMKLYCVVLSCGQGCSSTGTLLPQHRNEYGKPSYFQGLIKQFIVI